MTEIAKKIIKLDEGYRSKPYYCTERYPTIGYGRRIPGTQRNDRLPEMTTTREAEEAHFQEKFNEIVSDLSTNDFKKAFAAVNDVRKSVLINMAYQHGMYGLLKFIGMRRALGWGDYEKAADEIIDSQTWKDKATRPRMQRNADMMRTGELVEYYK